MYVVHFLLRSGRQVGAVFREAERGDWESPAPELFQTRRDRRVLFDVQTQIEKSFLPVRHVFAPQTLGLVRKEAAENLVDPGFNWCVVCVTSVC